jgi:hypothetical protein
MPEQFDMAAIKALTKVFLSEIGDHYKRRPASRENEEMRGPARHWWRTKLPKLPQRRASR